MLGYDGLERMNAEPVHQSLHVEHLAERFGPRVAFQTERGRLTYEQLAREVHAMRPAVGRSTGVCAVLASRNLDTFVALYTCLSERRPALLISPSAPEEVRRRLIERVGATDCYSEEGWSQHRAVPAAEGPSANDHILLPTSGTTGEPKIVCLTQDALISSALVSNENLQLQEDSSWGLTLPYAHVGGIAILVRCALAGARVVAKQFRFDTRQEVDKIGRESVSHLSLVPTQLHRAIETGAECPASLKAVLVGGASSAPGLRARARETGWPVAFTYGFTEAASQVATQELGRPTSATPERDVGRPLRGTEIALDGSGRLAVRGPTLMNRYWGGPERQADEWFVTQDFAHWDDADRLVIVGRADNMIISGGENVAAERVEEALLTLPFVDEAAVFGLADEKWGQRIVALVTGKATDLADIRGSLRGQLEAYALPKEVYFCDALPRLPTGKVDRRAAESRLLKLRPERISKLQKTLPLLNRKD